MARDIGSEPHSIFLSHALSHPMPSSARHILRHTCKRGILQATCIRTSDAKEPWLRSSALPSLLSTSSTSDTGRGSKKPRSQGLMATGSSWRGTSGPCPHIMCSIQRPVRIQYYFPVLHAISSSSKAGKLKKSSRGGVTRLQLN